MQVERDEREEVHVMADVNQLDTLLLHPHIYQYILQVSVFPNLTYV